ncbi:hypothetical protein M514_01235 [Trichuris suis]|uniref:Uncharacterized protein n=1 Tax=Trichuris suis TaxID=68888 RepID=A0A085NMW6_9BILA|nr:hypothetical protein M513_01235 [Trichuris suis]KFD70812.1 hypothetical protein M514_01235 [Trichuris suis]
MDTNSTKSGFDELQTPLWVHNCMKSILCLRAAKRSLFLSMLLSDQVRCESYVDKNEPLLTTEKSTVPDFQLRKIKEAHPTW